MKIKIALLLTVVLIASLLAACSGGGGIPDGTYVPAQGEFSSFSSLSFKGDSVTIGMIGGIMSYDNIPYTYKDGTLSFDLGGMNTSGPCEVNEDGSIKFIDVTYVKN
jgi:major membrane immunogen (membrane-anchored lipoprotein)